MLKIAHIAADEKFIEIATDIFETVFPLQNTFYITSSKPWRFIKDKDGLYKQLSHKRWLDLLFVHRSELKSYDLVVLHGLPTAWLIPMVVLKQRYVWLGWGYDYYSRTFDSLLLTEPLITRKTAEYVASSVERQHSRNTIYDILKAVSKRIARELFGSRFFFKIAMRNLKVFSPVLPEEYDMVKERYGLGDDTKYAPWNYGILEKHFINNIDADNIEMANDILLGNSATPTNNHIEILEILEHSRQHRTVYIPLSYGDMEYAGIVKDYIAHSSVLASTCKVLDTFMPLADYNTIINGCGFVIMNHVRQQALGNIVAMMYRGAKIFLREESVLYNHFKGINAYIYSIQELEADPQLLDCHLTHNEIQFNRALLQDTWSETVILQRTQALVDTALSQK